MIGKEDLVLLLGLEQLHLGFLQLTELFLLGKLDLSLLLEEEFLVFNYLLVEDLVQLLLGCQGSLAVFTLFKKKS